MSLFISPFNEVVVPQSILHDSLICNRSNRYQNDRSCKSHQNYLHFYMHLLHPNILDSMHLISADAALPCNRVANARVMVNARLVTTNFFNCSYSPPHNYLL